MLYEKIKALADDQNMTIAEIERHASISNGTISKWKTAIPNAANLYAVAKLLGTTVDDLLKGIVGDNQCSMKK